MRTGSSYENRRFKCIYLPFENKSCSIIRVLRIHLMRDFIVSKCLNNRNISSTKITIHLQINLAKPAYTIDENCSDIAIHSFLVLLLLNAIGSFLISNRRRKIVYRYPIC